MNVNQRPKEMETIPLSDVVDIEVIRLHFVYFNFLQVCTFRFPVQTDAGTV